MNASSGSPAADRILADLAPVRRLGRPWRRVLPVAIVGGLMAAAVSLGLGVRHDATLLGGGVLWGLSAFQMCYGLVLVGTALRVAVPGRALATRLAPFLLIAGAGVIATVTWITWLAHASHVPTGSEAFYWMVCFRTPLVVGLPALALTLVLSFRAYPTHPVLTGALAGLGAGLLSDGSWRTFCEVTDPAHVVTSHAASVAALALTGAAVAWLVGRRRSRAATASLRGSR
jgi:hypothetical protein